MRKNCSGFSLIEVVVGMLIFGVMLLAIIKTMQSHAVATRRSDEMTTASSLADVISAKIKSLPYDAVFSYDSRNPSPTVKIPPAITATDFRNAVLAENFIIPLSSSTIKPSLVEFQNMVVSAGFDGYKIGIVYLVRDNTNMNGASSVDDFISWGSWDAVWVGGPKKIVADRYQSQLVFSDNNLSGDYWDPGETPNTGIKKLTVTIFKKGNVMGVKTGTVLTKELFSGNEITDSMSTIVLGLSKPVFNVWFMQVTNDTVGSLTLETRHVYSRTKWDSNPRRVDNTTITPTVNKKLNIAGGSVANPQEITLIAPGLNYLEIVGVTNRDQGGYLEVCDHYGARNCWNFVAERKEYFTPAGIGFTLWDSVSPSFSDFSGPSFLMRPGMHHLFYRKESVPLNTGNYSPLGLRRIYVDTQAPRLVWNSSPGSYGGKSPFISMTVGDDFGGSSFNCCENQIAAALLVPSSTGFGRALYYPENGAANLKLSSSSNVNRSSNTYSLRDDDWFPPTLAENKTFTITWEFGDFVGYKASNTYTFSTPDLTSDSSSATYVISGAFSYTPPPILGVAPGAYFPVSSTVTYSVANLSFTDPESGINLSKFKLEVCQDAIVLPPIDPTFQTPGCLTLYSKNEGALGVRPDTTLLWGKYFQYGDDADPGKYFRPLIAQQFTSPGTGLLTGFDFVVGSKWRLRAYIENWKGLVTRTGDDEWRFEIVP